MLKSPKVEGLTFAQEAFIEIVNRFTPANWKQACVSNLGRPAFPIRREPAGY